MRGLWVLLVLFCACTAFAKDGDWSSGGGEILRTATNPWFLANTSTIHYCIHSDPNYFGNLPAPAQTQIDAAFQYWKDSFAASSDVAPNLAMATQTVVYQPACNSQTDIEFDLGELPPHIGDYISDPTSFIGLAVRTQYDERNLRGQGFIFIAADDGPLAYDGKILPHGAWHVGQGGKLFKVLVHELGHVFGLPHMDENIVMSARFPEIAVSSLSADQGLAWPVLEGSLLDGTVLQGCFRQALHTPFLDFFEIPFADRNFFCFQLKYDVKSEKGAAYYSLSSNGPYRLLGTIDQTQSNNTRIGGVTVWLPAAQTVFPGAVAYETIPGVPVMHREVTGTYTSAFGGQEKQILFTLTPVNWIAGAKIGGVVNGKVVFDLLH